MLESFPSHGSSLCKGFPCGDSRKLIFTLRYISNRQNCLWHVERTIRRCLLLSLLSPDSIRYHVNRDPLNVSPLTESHTWQDIQTITAWHSLLSASFSSPPTACLAVSLPKGRRNWVSTFRTVDPMDNLGAPSTPVVLRFRAGS